MPPYYCYSYVYPSHCLSYKRAAVDEPLVSIETPASGSNYNIRGLVPGTIYDIKMAGFNKDGNSAFTKSLFSKTWVMAPPRQMPMPMEIKVGTDYADVAWPLFNDGLTARTAW
jgi:hypothetical protein